MNRGSRTFKYGYTRGWNDCDAEWRAKCKREQMNCYGRVVDRLMAYIRGKLI